MADDPRPEVRDALALVLAEVEAATYPRLAWTRDQRRGYAMTQGRTLAAPALPTIGSHVPRRAREVLAAFLLEAP